MRILGFRRSIGSLLKILKFWDFQTGVPKFFWFFLCQKYLTPFDKSQILRKKHIYKAKKLIISDNNLGGIFSPVGNNVALLSYWFSLYFAFLKFELLSTFGHLPVRYIYWLDWRIYGRIFIDRHFSNLIFTFVISNSSCNINNHKIPTRHITTPDLLYQYKPCQVCKQFLESL